MVIVCQKQHLAMLSLIVFLFTTGMVGVIPCPAQTAGGSTSRAKQSSQLLKDGLTQFERGDLIGARELLQKVLSINPNEVMAHTYLGFIADKMGDLKEAERHFSLAIKKAPSLASARNNYGAILLRTGRADQAAAQFEASLKLDRNQPNALVNLGQIRFAAGTSDDIRAASELFARAYAIQPDVEIARALTVTSLRLKDSNAATLYYREYATRLNRETETSAHTAVARAELGAALLEAGLLIEAEQELKAAAELDLRNSESVLNLARVYLARKNLPAAGRTLEAAVAGGVDEAPIYALLAEVYEQSGHIENAIPAMRLAIQRDPQSERYRFAYAVLLTNAYAPGAAVIRLQEALETFPASSRLWFALGLAHFKHNKSDEAAKAFQRAIELDERFAAAFAYLGVTRVELGAYAEGISLYEKALKADPKLGVAHYLIAEALLKQTDSDAKRIEGHLKKAIELDSSFTLARLSLAKLYMRATRWAEALIELETIAKLDPEAAETYYQLGRAYVRLKRPHDAQLAMTTFKRLSETQKERERTEIQEITKRLSTVLF